MALPGSRVILISSSARSHENASRIEQVLEQFGFASLGLKAADFEQPGRVVQLGIAPNRIDLLTSLTGVTFDEVWTERVQDALDGIPVAFISRKQFLLNKRAAGRPKDIADLAALGEAVD